MKKMTKRLLSVFLAAVMVFTTVPFAAIVAFAKRTGTDIPTSYAYLTKNLDGFQSSGNVTWDATEKAAKFDGGTLTLNNFDAFANVDHDSAFAICFDFKKTSSNPTYGFVFQLDNGVGVNENRFGFNAGGSDDHRGLTYATTNNSHNVYWSQDFGDSSKAFISQNNGSWGTSWKPENDTWYNVALFMAGGELQYYLNGNWIGTFNAPSEGSLTNAQIMDNMKNLTTLFVGKSSNSGDGTFRGYVKNLQFFSYAQNNAPSALKTALDAYEAKMEDGKVYKNLSNAYAKYQQAAARYDAYIYGDLDLTAQTNGTTNSDLLNGASQELALATGAMQPLEAAKAGVTTNHGVFSNDSNNGTYAEACNNLLYLQTGIQKNSTYCRAYNEYGSTKPNDPFVKKELYYPEATMLYVDSNSKPTIPVMLRLYSNSGGKKNRWALSAFQASGSNWELTKKNGSYLKWFGKCGGNLDFSWAINGGGGAYFNATSTNDGSYSTSDTLQTCVKGGTFSSNTYDDGVYANYITYTGSMNDNTTDDTITPSFTVYCSGDSNAYKNSDNLNGTVTGNVTIHVINYARYLNKVNSKKSDIAAVCGNITNFKEGGAAAYLAKVDEMTGFDINSYFTSSNDYTTCISDMTTAMGKLDSPPSTTTDTSKNVYKAVKNAIDYSGTNAAGENTTVLAAVSKKTANSATNGENNGGYIKGLYQDFIVKYNAAVAAMAALADKSAYPTASVATTASNLIAAFQALDVVDIDQPTATPVSGRLLSATDTVTITNPEYNKNDGAPRGQTAYTVAFSDGSTALTGTITGATASATVTPFSGKTTPGLTATVTATASATLSGDSYSRDSAAYTYTLYTAPVISNTNVNYNEGVVITSTNAQTGTIQYSLDGTTWSNYNPQNPYAPFSSTAADTSTVTIYVRETKTLNDSESQSYTVTSSTSSFLLERSADFDIKAKYADGSIHAKGASYYDENSHFTIDNAGTYSANITYTLYIDGTLDNSYTYDKANGIAMTSAIQNASFIKIVAFATDRQNNTIQTEKLLFNVAKYSPMIFRESFNTKGDDGVKVENMHLYKKDGTDYNLYATPAGTIALEKGAGTKTASGTEAHSWRNNVLKINANSTAPGPVVTFENNPLSESYSAINASAARSEGVTIAFWRHLEDGSGNTVSLPASGDVTGYPWRNAIAFQKKNDNTAYYIIEVNGVNSRRIDGSHYQDVVPENQDKTEHEEGNNNGEWEHVAITINPNTGIHVYTNGVEHDYKYVKINAGSGESSKTDIKSYAVGTETTANAAEIINFLTASDTEFTLDNGVMYEGNEYNLFLDDIRIYAQSLSQVDINNMFTDEYADVQTNVTSTSHDPTTVTVYTLGEAVTTDNGTKAAGSKVGQEFIDYYKVPESKISQIEYYSFGTGMTIYKAGGTEKTITGDMQIQWNVLGDSEGRCGYQNQELFGAEYHTALAEVATYVQGTGASTGAGHLVWAPHVMYNLTLDKWVYYAAMSSWGVNRSATFYATSNNPISGYAYQGMIYKSSSYHPNAIDSCVYYGYDKNTGKPIKSDLYMVIGSWGHVHRDGRYDAIYGTQINANGSAPAALSNNIDSLEEPGTPNSLGVNSYALVRGYTGDLEGTNYESGGSGEGAYVQYINGYYYLFVSYGQNEGSYTERVFRATTPLGTDKTNAHINTYTEYTGTNGFQANDDRLKSVLDDDNALINYVRGNQILAPFDNSIYTKTYRSTGHNSVYKARNNDGEWVYVNAVHARPYASKSHNWTAVQDNALAKRQSGGVTGNVCFNNMLAITEHGWLVMYPYQYNGNDSVYKEVKASKLEGLYYGNNMRQIVNSDWDSEYQYTILANPEDESDTTGIIFGVRDENDFRMKFKLVRDASGDKVQYIRIYNDSASFAQILADSVSPIHEGVIGIHNKSGESVPMIATLNIDSDSEEYGMQFWAYRMGNIPDVDKVISHGDLVSMDGVIYTHASDKEVLALAGTNVSATSDKGKAALAAGYAVYGQEISNNYTYGQNNYASGGERYTTLTTKFPATVDMDKAGNIISLNDNDYCRYYGESGSNMRFVELNNGKWCTKNADGSYTQTAYTDEEAAAAVEANPSLELYKVYGIEGKVSSFFRYYDNTNDGIGVRRNGYPKVGVTLVVSYVDVTDGTKYSEFEFCYVMPNPAWAHTMAAMKNNNSDIANNRNSSFGIFNRFEGSYGKATELSSTLIRYPASGTNTQNEEGWGYGVSGYLTDFSTHSFADGDLDTIDEIKTLFNFYQNESIGVNSGSFAARGHDDSGPNAYASVPQVIDTQYYVDYSDKSQYKQSADDDRLITVSNGKPTGYQFKMKTSNFLWANYSGASIMDVTCYQMNKTGMNITYTTQPATSNAGPNVDEYLGSYTTAGNYNANFEHFGTDVTISGYKRWFDDSMLFHTDLRNNTNSYFNFPYRNKLLFYFSDGTQNYLKKDDVSYHLLGKGSDYVDGTAQNDTPSKVYNYYNYAGSKAYTVVPNGKASTNTWTGTATFTGKNRVTANTLDSLNKNYGDGRYYDANAKRVYDGYYYYENANNDVKRECWTADQTTAQNSTVSSWGKMDVTAENYANYILEMGNYHKVTDTGIKGGRFLGNETYHYYNIGVATCDKGAARDFLENYGLKLLAVTEDPVTHKKTVIRDADTGRPTVTGDMNVEDISAASYRDYINAIAKLSWFVKNPQNTLQNDLKGETTYDDVDAIQNASADEYTTAYSNGTALYYQDKTGANIFTDGTTNTDAVQAQLIDDVIKAYENLYTVEDYKRVEQEYKATKDAIDAAIEAANGDYTDESIANYNKDFEAIKKAVEYYTDITGVNKDEDIDSTLLDFDDDEYWRYSNYSGADYETLRDAMQEIQKSLMPKVVTSVLSTTATSQAGVVRDGAFDTNGVQTKRIDQWASLYNAVCNADGSQFNTADGTVQTKAPIARYDTENAEVKSLNDVLNIKRVENDPSTHLDYVVYRTELPAGTTAHEATYYDANNGTADVYVGIDDNNDGTFDDYALISSDQKDVNAENYELSQMTVDSVDIKDAYDAYNAAYDVVSESVIRDKYTDAGKAILDNALSTRYNAVNPYNFVYLKATQDDVNEYAAITGKTAPFSANDDLKCTGIGETDPITAYLLSETNKLEAAVEGEYPYIRKFTVDFDVTGGANTYATQTKQAYYGDMVSFTIPEEARANATFSYQYYDDEGEATYADKEKYTFNGDTLTRVAKSNMTITAKVTNAAVAEGYKVEIRNIYGTVIDIRYCAKANLPEGDVATLVINGETIEPKSVPFYTFTKWERSIDDETSTAVYTPVYTAGDGVTFNVVGIDNSKVSGASATASGSTSYTTAFDELVTIDASDVSGFYAWATEIVDGGATKYQIASYSPSYSFYAVYGEKFVPVIKVSNDYKVGETTLAAANVDSVYDIKYDGDGVITADKVLKQKLDDKAPFIATVGAKMSDSNTAATVYCRVTEGASITPSEYAVLARSIATADADIKNTLVPSVASKFKTSTVLSTGQFIFTIRKATPFARRVLFRGYITYDFNYEFGGTNTQQDASAKLNIGEYSDSVAIANLA